MKPVKKKAERSRGHRTTKTPVPERHIELAEMEAEGLYLSKAIVTSSRAGKILLRIAELAETQAEGLYLSKAIVTSSRAGKILLRIAELAETQAERSRGHHTTKTPVPERHIELAEMEAEGLYIIGALRTIKGTCYIKLSRITLAEIQAGGLYIIGALRTIKGTCCINLSRITLAEMEAGGICLPITKPTKRNILIS